MGFFGYFWPFWPFWPNLALFPDPRESPRGGFYINPSRRPPRNPEKGVLGGFPGKGPKRAFFALFGQNPRNSGFSGPGPRRGSRTAPGNRGAPARGVDVKPPSRGDPPGLPGPPRPLGRSQTPSGVPEASGRPSRAPPGEGDPRPGAPRLGVLHQPLAAAPRGSPGASRGPPSRGPGLEPLRRGRGAPAPEL